jgi:hypothetical protein
VQPGSGRTVAYTAEDWGTWPPNTPTRVATHSVPPLLKSQTPNPLRPPGRLPTTTIPSTTSTYMAAVVALYRGKSLGQQPHDSTAVGRTPGKYSSLSPPVFRLLSLFNVAMEGKHLVILCHVSFGDKTIASHALIDCGATGVAFVDEDFARHHQLPLTPPLKYPRALKVIDGHPISSGNITHTGNTTLSIYEHREQIPMFVTTQGHYPIVLGIPWMELHDVAIRFSYRTLTFESQYCIANCNPVPTVAHTISSEPPEPALCSLVSKVAPAEPAVSAGASDIGAQLFTSPRGNNTARADRTEPRLDVCNGLGLDARNGLGLEAPGLRLDTRNGLGLEPPGPSTKPIQIAALGRRSFRWIAHKEQLTVFSLSLYEITRTLESKKEVKQLNLADYMSKEYHEFLPLFSEAMAKALPPYWPYDHMIPLREGCTPPFGPLYSLSKTELQALKGWLEENLSKRFICTSSSSATSPLCRLPRPERRNHQEPGPPAATARNADASLEGQILHHPGHPWCLQPDKDGRGGGIENSLPDTVCPF